MQTLRELMQVSAHGPVSGYSQDLAKLANAGLSRAEALERWTGLGRSEGSFYSAYKAFKDELVKLAFLDRKASGQEGKRMEIFEKHKVVNQLLIAGKKNAAVSIAIELMDKARKTGLTQVVVGLASMLEEHFGGIEVDTRRYLRYRKIRKDYARMLADELDVKGLQAKVMFSIARKKDLRALQLEIRELVDNPIGTVTYLRYRFSILSAWFQLKNDTDMLLKAFRETIHGYENSEVEVSTATLANLYFRLTPILAGAGQFANAEAHISKALQSQLPGSQNWHLFLLQRGCLGHVSGKAGMMRGALALAQATPVLHENPVIGECWERVEMLLDGEVVGDVWAWVMGN